MIDPEKLIEKLPEKLIDLERKTVSPQVFADPEVHRLEQERIFTRCWLYVGHESQLPNPGDFISGFMGEEPVIVCRGADRIVPPRGLYRDQSWDFKPGGGALLQQARHGRPVDQRK